MTDSKNTRTEEEWKEILTPEQYRILREGHTESPFSGIYLHTKDDGVYACVACGSELFSSDSKFYSGTGWPSFTEPLQRDKVTFKEDDSFSMKRTEVLCAQCDSHLGHVFDDILEDEEGYRYCINSTCLTFHKEDT